MKKIAIVGFGFMGMTHAKSILKNDDLDLVAIVDKDLEGIEGKMNSDEGNFSTGEIDPELIRAVNKYGNLSACLQKNEVDAVIVSVHTDLHYRITKEALKAGKHVFVEKPFCLDIHEGEELISLAKEMNRILMVGHVVRFMPPYRKLREWITSEKYGKLNFLSLSRYSGIPTWGQWKEKQTDYGSSGGALFDLLIHDIDFLNFTLGNPDQIKSTNIPGALSKYDYVSAWWDYPKFKVKVEGGNTFHSNFPFQANFMAAFETASVYYSTNQPDFIRIADNVGITNELLGKGDGFYNEIEYFASCLESLSEPLECMPESALESIKICYKHIK